MNFASKSTELKDAVPSAGKEQVEEIIELGEDTLEFISGALLLVCDTEGPH